MYERSCYVGKFPSLASQSPEIANQTLTLGSVGKSFNATGWRVGWLIGSPTLIQPVQIAHTLLCYTTNRPAQEAGAAGLEKAAESGFWSENIQNMRGKVDRFLEVLDELKLPVSSWLERDHRKKLTSIQFTVC